VLNFDAITPKCLCDLLHVKEKRKNVSLVEKKNLIASGEASIINFVQVHKVLKFTKAKLLPIKDKVPLTSNC